MRSIQSSLAAVVVTMTVVACMPGPGGAGGPDAGGAKPTDAAMGVDAAVVSGADAGNPDAGGDRAANAAACRAWAEAYCDYRDKCYNRTHSPECPTEATQACLQLVLLPGVDVDPNSWLVAAGSLASRTCVDAFQGSNQHGEVFPLGRLSVASDCRFDAECGSGKCSGSQEPALGAVVPGQRCGTCVGWASAGEPCGPANLCSSDTYCVGVQVGNSVQTVCAQRSRIGGQCDPALLNSCADGLKCRHGICDVYRDLGAGCETSGEDCTPFIGYTGLLCSRVTLTCTEVEWRQSGEACGVYEEGSLCAPSTVCVPETMLCAERPRRGDACDTAAYFPCNGLNECIGGTCAPIPIQVCPISQPP